MRTFIQTLFFFLLVTQICFAQQDFWEQTGGPPGGRFGNNSGAMNSLGHIFCASLNGYVYRSTNHGLSWEQLTNGLPKSGGCISLAINNKDYVFVGIWYGEMSGVFRSTDNGESWTQTTFPYYFPIRMTSDYSGGILVATFHDGAGIVRSTDDGETWSAIGPITGAEMISVAVSKNGYIFAGAGLGDYKAYRSTDNGLTWSLTGLDFGVHDFAFNSQGHVFAIRGWSSSSTSLYISTDDGENWDTINTLPPLPQEHCYISIAIDSSDNVFIGGYGGSSYNLAYRSTDGCQTWTKISDFMHPNFLFDQYGHILMLTYNIGILHSTDMGYHWQLTGPVITRVRSLSSTPSGILLAGLNFISPEMADAGIFYSATSGSSWEAAGLNLQSIPCILALNSDSILIGTDNGIYLTTDYGTNWTTSGLPNTSVLCMERALDGNIFAGTGSSGLYRSTDNGTSWSFVGLMDKSIRSLFTEDSQTIYVGTENLGVYRSVDGGINWSFLGLANTTIFSLSIIGNEIFAGTNSGIYKSPDNGTSWLFAGLNGRAIQDLIATSSDDIYVATSDSGVYHSNNGGQTWTILNSGLNHLNVTSLLIDNDGYLYAGTDGGGVYKSSEVVVGLNEEIDLQPTDFELFQNYPNPFNPNTKIKYSVPQSSQVIIKVFDVLGNEIETLVNEEKPAGTYEISWYAENLPSGVYFYKLNAGNYSNTKKMILLK